MAGAPIGNQNAHAGKLWRDAIRRALAKTGREADPEGDGAAWERGLTVVAEKFVNACVAGEPWALRDIGDRIDGKPAQSVDIGGELNIPVSGTVKFVQSTPDK